MLNSLKKILLERENFKSSEEMDEEILLGDDNDLDDVFDCEIQMTEGKTYTADDFSDIPEDDPNLGDDDLDALLDEKEETPVAEEACKNKGMSEDTKLGESFFSDEGQNVEEQDSPVKKEDEEDLVEDDEIDAMMEEDYMIESLYENEDFLNLILSEESDKDVDVDLNLDTTDDLNSANATKIAPEMTETEEEITADDVETTDSTEDFSESFEFLDFMEL